MFIKLHASFQAEGQPSFENLGIEPTSEDLHNSDWEEVFFNADQICTLNINDAGYTNVNLINGEGWSVKETPQEIVKMINESH